MAITKLSDEVRERFLGKEVQGKLTTLIIEGWETLERVKENNLSREEFSMRMKKMMERLESLDAKAKLRNIQAQEGQD